jgi:D-sedoheptulose 7-phosphate isomerase
MTIRQYLGEASAVLEATATAVNQDVIDAAIDVIVAALPSKPLLVCGNGGSAADAMHITGELVGRFLRDRLALRVICLSENPVVLTAWSNDFSFDTVFARQVEAYGETGAVLVGISTSGNSRNVIAAFQQARNLGMKTIALTGDGGTLWNLADYVIAIPSKSTPLIQQCHVCVYHYLCQKIEERMVERLS